MKPISLVIDAFGAFAGHVEVDFAALAPRGLFLVSGETGSGKTTIFDAMCWALYGTMPLKDTRGVRSDHVDASTRCEVRFTFESGGSRYVVTRNPDQYKSPARKTSRLVQEKAAATLEKVTATGTESIATKVRDVRRVVEEIIGLDDTQFQRVILLPQGDFSRFLLAKTDEREKILAKLFGGSVYGRIVDELKVVSEQAAGELGEADIVVREKRTQARSHLGDAARTLGTHVLDDDTQAADGSEPSANGSSGERDTSDGEEPDTARLRSEMERLAEIADTRRTLVDDAVQTYEAAKSAHEQATTGAKRFDKAAKLRTRLEDLTAQTEKIETARAEADASRGARPIADAGEQVEEATIADADAGSLRDARGLKIAELFASLGRPSEVTDPVAMQRVLAELQSDHEDAQVLLETLQTTVDAEAELHRSRTNLDAETEKVTARHQETIRELEQFASALPELQTAASDLDGIDDAIAKAANFTTTKLELDRVVTAMIPANETLAAATAAYDRAFRAFIDTQAPRLAATLTDGDACPVCGSTEHPAPADADGTEPVTWEQVDAAARHQKAAIDDLGRLQAEQSKLRGKLGEAADTPVETLRHDLEMLESQRDLARDARLELERIQAETTKLATSRAELERQLAVLEERRVQSDKALVVSAQTVAAATKATAGLDADEIGRNGTTLEGLVAALEGYDGLVAAAHAAHTMLTARRGDLDRLLAAGPYDDLPAVHATLLSEDAEARAINAAKAHESDVTETKAALATLQAEGVPGERPDPAATEAALRTASDTRTRLDKQLTTAVVHLDNARATLDDLDDLERASGELRALAELTRRVYKVCHQGGSRLGVSLKRWVLAHELDRITTAANVHLAQMTSGRYVLGRAIHEGDGPRTLGLDLEVFDANTGRARATSSLSGGEQFQASLALALGLADVISHGGTAGGQTFEALFVDEGFGSLSAKALDDAVDTLNRLQDAGRMVGAITHVEAMKEALHVGIQVTRRADGKGSTLVVNP